MLPAYFNILKHLGNNNYIINHKQTGAHYICKSHTTSGEYDKYESQLYSYMKRHPIVYKYVNPLAMQINDSANNLTHSIYPIIHNGFRLSELVQYINRLHLGEQLILKHIIVKNILHGVGNLHKIQIIHGNITSDNIIVLFQDAPLNIKFINFEHSCGKFAVTSKVPDYYYRKCNTTRKLLRGDHLFSNNHNDIPPVFTDEIQNMKLHDITAVGLICMQLLIPPSHLHLLATSAPNRTRRMAELLIQLKTRRHSSNNMESRLTKIHKKYIVYIITHLLLYPFKRNNNPAKYVVDKIIIYEKYI